MWETVLKAKHEDDEEKRVLIEQCKQFETYLLENTKNNVGIIMLLKYLEMSCKETAIFDLTQDGRSLQHLTAKL